ncbi:hypothetical protein [Arthrobacter burdickii]|uniref:NERD domain-containing protein n=1 Tax=Arthrobacter burdickii TaxID=3035920 RepID=A0ABT8K4H1_9MICC|nr:hypothetical protein [Arthrobacter burdickii]MDN4612356.1 hypothetical protein [Arthrobacter burdickii]
MLHFPSKNSAAHTADPADVTRLHQLLCNHVWAFSNCRVDAPGLPVAEVDWLFYNSINGTFILSEWKRFPAPVIQVTDTGEPWVLANGSLVPNPVEQVGKQLDAVRRALRLSICRKHFPSADQHSINLYPSVYSPQVNEATRRERLRYGVVHGSLDEVALMVERRAVTVPLIAAGGTAQVDLAEALAELFRCSISQTVRRKIAPPIPVVPSPQGRIAAIHRELAALHLELAALLDEGSVTAVTLATLAPELVPRPPAAAPVAPSKPSTVEPIAAPKSSAVVLAAAPVTQKTAPPVAGSVKKVPPGNGHLKRHVVKHVPSSAAGPDHVRAAFLAALQDGQLRKSGVHVGQFGALVGQRLEKDRNLASLALGSLGKWCLAQAAVAGIAAVKDAADPSIVRVKG